MNGRAPRRAALVRGSSKPGGSRGVGVYCGVAGEYVGEAERTGVWIGEYTGEEDRRGITDRRGEATP